MSAALFRDKLEISASRESLQLVVASSLAIMAQIKENRCITERCRLNTALVGLPRQENLGNFRNFLHF